MKSTVDHKHEVEYRKYQKYLLERELTLSPARESIFWDVINTHGHFTAEELAKRSHGVSRATVYRCLKELLEAEVIRETAFGDKHHHFEHVYDEKLHHHARCINCQQFIEIPDLNEDRQYHPILKKRGFKILGHELLFYGICKDCVG